MEIFKEGEYLTEDRLYLVLKELFGGENVERQFKVGKYKVDFLVNKELVLEFDGYRHYNSSKNENRDHEVYILCKEQELHFMSIPYFIQYPYVCEALGFSGEDFGYQYPNGFIDKKALRPKDFNVQGLISFLTQIKTFTDEVQEDIISTFDRDDKESCQIISDYIDRTKDQPTT